MFDLNKLSKEIFMPDLFMMSKAEMIYRTRVSKA